MDNNAELHLLDKDKNIILVLKQDCTLITKSKKLRKVFEKILENETRDTYSGEIINEGTPEEEHATVVTHSKKGSWEYLWDIYRELRESLIIESRKRPLNVYMDFVSGDVDENK